MKTREELQAMVDRLKVINPSKMFCRAKPNLNSRSFTIGHVIGAWVPVTHTEFNPLFEYAIEEADFQLPPEPVKERTVKWFNCDTGRTLDCSEGICPGEAWVEVPVKVEPTFDSIIERLEKIIKELKEQK